MKSQENIWNEEYKNNKNKWRKETINFPKIKKNSRVLELGVGNGKTLKSILMQKPKEITAIDFSQEAINQIISNKNFQKVNFLKSNIKKLPFKEKTFDIIVCYYVLNNLLKKERIQAVNEMFRILNQQGQILFQDFSVDDFRQREKLNKILEKNTTQNKSGLICHFFTKTELKILFKNFSKINITLKISKPIIHKPNLKRKIISGIIIK